MDRSIGAPDFPLPSPLHRTWSARAMPSGCCEFRSQLARKSGGQSQPVVLRISPVSPVMRLTGIAVTLSNRPFRTIRPGGADVTVNPYKPEGAGSIPAPPILLVGSFATAGRRGRCASGLCPVAAPVVVLMSHGGPRGRLGEARERSPREHRDGDRRLWLHRIASRAAVAGRWR